MRFTILALAAVAIAATPAGADPGDHYKKQWEKRADCDKKLYEAKRQRDFYQKAAECNRELRKLSLEQRRESAKAWREAEKKWRERPYYDWDDD